MKITAPRSIGEALTLAEAAAGSFRFAAGATSLQLEWQRGAPRPALLIDISRIAELGFVAREATAIRLGATATLADLILDVTIGRDLPLLAAALKTVAGPAVRNLATIGGNVANRNGCLLPALLALDAEVELATTGGKRRLPLAAWLAETADPAEILLSLTLAPQPAASRSSARKTGLRAAFTPSVIGMAATFTLAGGRIKDARLAIGGGVVPPRRLAQTEALILDRPLADLDFGALRAGLIMEIAAPDDGLRTGRYRSTIAANLIVLALGGALPGRPLPSKVRAVEKADDPPPPPGEIALSRSGQPHRWFSRPDMDAKISGAFPYLTDKRLPNMLVGRILRAGIPHGRILAIDTGAAEALPGVAAVVTHRDVRGQNAFGIVVQDQPALAFDKVRHCGDMVAAVAAVDEATAERALGLIRVDYEPLPLVDDPEQALASGAAAVHAGGNLQREIRFGFGDVEKGFADAAHIVEETYYTPRQMHGFLETEGGYAFVEADGCLNMFCGGQHGGRDRLQLSRILAMPEERIRVVTSPTGGAFGGKDELSVQPALALLALKTGRPVRLQLSRAESMLGGQKRNPMAIRMKTACDGEGRLTAQQVSVLADAGAYASLGPGVLETALEHATGPYLVPHVETHGRLAYTNNGLCGAFRGFGANQMTFAVECQIDRLAALAGLTPVEIRARNLRRPGMPGYLGQAVSKSERVAEMLAAAAASPLWEAIPAGETPDAGDDGEWLTGTGMALNYQGNGLGSVIPDPAGGRLTLAADGLIEGGYGLDELGQGLAPLIQATVAVELGCDRADVRPLFGDTRHAPESGSTTASRGTYVVWASARKAAPDFRAAMQAAAGRLLDRAPETLVLAPGGLAERGSNSGAVLISYRDLAARLAEHERPSVTVAYEFPKTNYGRANARYIFAFGAALARVAVSRATGEVRVLDLHQHSAAGPVMDLAAYLGQLEGGAVQGLGFTLTEDAPMQGGRHRTGNLDSYMLPGIQDAPQRMRVFALEDLDPDDDLGPRGAGELGIGAVTPAIANAVAAAIGRWPALTPFSPAAILAAIEETSCS